MWEVLCPNTTFHASRDSAGDWLAARPGLDGQILGQLTAFVCYGKRLRDSAHALGLPVEAPA